MAIEQTPSQNVNGAFLFYGGAGAVLALVSVALLLLRLPVMLEDPLQWWRYVPGADWRHPEGPSGSIEGKGDHPVVNVAYDGWMAEGQSQDNYYLLPEDLDAQSVCAMPRDFSIGQQVRVYYREGGPKSLRAAPGVDAPLLFSLVRNMPMVIEGGPICRDDLNWWQVRVLASTPVTGWMAEGSPGVGYWIAPLN